MPKETPKHFWISALVTPATGSRETQNAETQKTVNIYNQLIIDVRDDMSDDDSIDIIREKLEKAFDRDDIAVTDRDQNLSFAT